VRVDCRSAPRLEIIVSTDYDDDVVGGISRSARALLAPVTRDVMLELLDDESLFRDDVFDQVSDRDEAEAARLPAMAGK
jgi:hypothetical protein